MCGSCCQEGYRLEFMPQPPVHNCARLWWKIGGHYQDDNWTIVLLMPQWLAALLQSRGGHTRFWSSLGYWLIVDLLLCIFCSCCWHDFFFVFYTFCYVINKCVEKSKLIYNYKRVMRFPWVYFQITRWVVTEYSESGDVIQTDECTAVVRKHMTCPIDAYVYFKCMSEECYW